MREWKNIKATYWTRLERSWSRKTKLRGLSISMYTSCINSRRISPARRICSKCNTHRNSSHLISNLSSSPSSSKCTMPRRQCNSSMSSLSLSQPIQDLELQTQPSHQQLKVSRKRRPAPGPTKMQHQRQQANKTPPMGKESSPSSQVRGTQPSKPQSQLTLSPSSRSQATNRYRSQSPLASKRTTRRPVSATRRQLLSLARPQPASNF